MVEQGLGDWRSTMVEQISLAINTVVAEASQRLEAYIVRFCEQEEVLMKTLKDDQLRYQKEVRSSLSPIMSHDTEISAQRVLDVIPERNSVFSDGFLHYSGDNGIGYDGFLSAEIKSVNVVEKPVFASLDNENNRVEESVVSKPFVTNPNEENCASLHSVIHGVFVSSQGSKNDVLEDVYGKNNGVGDAVKKIEEDRCVKGEGYETVLILDPGGDGHKKWTNVSNDVAVLNPMAAMFGGIVGPEVRKAYSGKFHALFQFFYVDSIESLPTEQLDLNDFRPLNSPNENNVPSFDPGGAELIPLHNSSTVSSGGEFELGFFSPGSSKNRYLGIRFKIVSNRTVVWVANREAPILDTSGVLRIDVNGNLELVNGRNSTMWLSNSTKYARNDPVVAQLMDSSNLVISLSGMKLGWDLSTRLERYLRSGKSVNDPSPGNYTFIMYLEGYPQMKVTDGSTTSFRFGPWDGIQFSGVAFNIPDLNFDFKLIVTDNEIYSKFDVNNNFRPVRFDLNPDGYIELLTWFDNFKNWTFSQYISVLYDECDLDGLCGAYGSCGITRVQSGKSACECLEGFVPKSAEKWKVADWSDRFVRAAQLTGGSGDSFQKIPNLKLPSDHAKLDGCIILEVNIMDKIVMALSYDLKILAEGCPVDKEIDIEVDFTAPENPGCYDSCWRMATSNLSLVGDIPDEISNCRFLLELDVSGNAWQGNIPSKLYNMSYLVILDMHQNRLIGSIPSALGNLSELQLFDLSENSLSGQIPSQWNLLNLTHFNLSYNNLSGVVPSSSTIQKFGALAFFHNAGLCGAPLTSCLHNGTIPTTGKSKILSVSAIVAAAVILTGVGIVTIFNMRARCWRSDDSNIDLTSPTSTLATFVDRSSSVPEIQPTNGFFSVNFTWSKMESLRPTIEIPIKDGGLLRNQKNKNKGKLVTLDACLGGVTFDLEDKVVLWERGIVIDWPKPTQQAQ